VSTNYTLKLDSGSAPALEVSGGKGASLARMTRSALPVPAGYIVTTDAYRCVVSANDLNPLIEDALSALGPDPSTDQLDAAARKIADGFLAATVPADVVSALHSAYEDLGGDMPVAVRSSATAEDLPELSFAGQQDTYLNVIGSERVLWAVRRCWASLWTARAIDYRLRHGVQQESVALAVVVQHLVPAEAAGVLFTTNPLNGRSDEMVINAAWGLGESVVGGQVTPDTVVADRATGGAKSIDIGHKDTMTVATAEGTGERAVEERHRDAQVLTSRQIAELCELGIRVEAVFGAPQDVEWCLTDGTFSIVQARPITTLAKGTAPVPEVPPAETWHGPSPRARYLRNNIVELIPDPMTPLFATLGRNSINRSMGRLMTHFMGHQGWMPEQLIVEIEGYAYYNGDFDTKGILQILWHSVGIARRMFTGVEARWREADTAYRAKVAEYQGRDWQTASSRVLLQTAPEVLDLAISYYGALVGGLIPAAWISEGLFTVFYKALVRRKSGPRPEEFLLGFDSIPIRGAKALYDLAQWAATIPSLTGYLTRADSPEIADQIEAPVGVPDTDWGCWRSRLDAYLLAYGATIYDLDIAKPTPADDPRPVLETLKLYLRGEGTDPHARQRATAEARRAAVTAVETRLRGLRQRWFRTLLDRAQTRAPQREDGLATLGLGYPTVRAVLMELGRRLVAAGFVSESSDVFWLAESELATAARALDAGTTVGSGAAAVAERKALWYARREVVPPMGLPLPPKLVRRLFPALGSADDAPGSGDGEHALRGTPCSQGVVIGTARVLRGPEDFGQLEVGDVLVAAITTPAWTPLFARAGAVVTDVGGPLSHGSIVAREYGIPAVLGTGDASRKIRSGDRVRVDGGTGQIRVLQSP